MKCCRGGGGDIVTELFKSLPSMEIAHYLVVSEEDRAQFAGWTDAIVAANTVEGGVTGALETVVLPAVGHPKGPSLFSAAHIAPKWAAFRKRRSLRQSGTWQRLARLRSANALISDLIA
ncbi:hypothetical protein BST29_15855 [Mycobacterium malmoense]|uniref:Uncharacterized protein n=1 Tax=Mycobacterium malmoense TaxID=1780 RepID=A0ABX3SPW2_MYCMA|nr:hypothetical protein BMG05_01210 [Mycobacterium malmoense]ORA80623.1 hypothetical protein BST29_15855 [Mycobacterium malmoense]